MGFQFFKHDSEQMIRRWLTIDIVTKAIEFPDQVLHDQNYIIYQKFDESL